MIFCGLILNEAFDKNLFEKNNGMMLLIVLNYKQIHVVTKNFCKGRYIDIMYLFMTFVNFLAVVLVTFTVLYELPCIKSNNVVSEQA